MERVMRGQVAGIKALYIGTQKKHGVKRVLNQDCVTLVLRKSLVNYFGTYSY